MNIAFLAFAVVPLAIFLLGVITGGLSNVTSGGAGLFTIYVLTNYASLVIQRSTGTVLAASTIMVLVGAITFHRKRQVNSFLAITVGLSGVAGAFLAAEWASSINPTSLERYFGLFTLGLAIYTGYRFLSERRKVNQTKFEAKIADPASLASDSALSDSKSSSSPQSSSSSSSSSLQKSSSSANLTRFAGKDPLALAIQLTNGILIGFATGLFGVGLASLSIVLFILLFRLDVNTALGTSLFASFFRYLGGSAGYLATSQIDLFYFVVLVVGGALGSIAGARFILGGNQQGSGLRSKENYVKLIIVGIMLFISYEFLLKFLIFH